MMNRAASAAINLSLPIPSRLLASPSWRKTPWRGTSSALASLTSSEIITRTLFNASGALLAAAFPPAGVAEFAAHVAKPLTGQEPTCRRCTVTGVTGDEADQLSDVLLSFGAQSVMTEEHRPPGAAEQQIYSDGGPSQLWDRCTVIAHFAMEHDIAKTMAVARDILGLDGALTSAAGDAACTALAYVVEDVPNQAWVDQIKASYVPLRISESLYIIPEWSEAPDPSATNVILQPGVAFGTGEHPTTRLCLQFLEAHATHLLRPTSSTGGATVMDYGAGSGVLAIAALLLGAVRAAGTDVDNLAVRAARRNAELNGVADRFEVVPCGPNIEDAEPLAQAGLPEGQQFDVVMANILKGPLVELQPRLSSYCRPGGTLVLSGILEAQAADVRATYRQGFGDFEMRSDGSWAVLWATKK